MNPFSKRRGQHNYRLYSILEVDKTATDDEIKRAYKKMALKNHPDKNPQATEETFKEINNAYHVLSDPTKRKIYDEYGEEGLVMYENGMFGEDGELMGVIPYMESPLFLSLICCLVLVFVGLIFLIPMFVSLKVDKSVNWSWGVVFIPLWIIDGIILIYLLLMPCLAMEKKLAKTLVTLIEYLCLLAFQIVLCINLGREVQWKWAAVFVPVFVFQFLQTLSRVIGCRRAAFKEELEMNTVGMLFGIGYYGFIIRKLMTPMLIWLFIILLVVRLDDTNWNWWINSIPIFLLMVWKMITRIGDDQEHMKAAEMSPEERSSNCCSMLIMSVLMFLLEAFFFSSVIMIFLKLNGNDIRLILALIPMFILISLVFLCCCCCFPLLCCQMLCAGDEGENIYQEDPPVDWERRYNIRPDGGPRSATPPMLTYGTSNTVIISQNENQPLLS